MAGPGTVGGLIVERVIALAGVRAVVIAREPGRETLAGGGAVPGGAAVVAGGARRLVSRIPWEPGHHDQGLAMERAPWDLPLVALVPDGEEALLIIEALTAGDPAWGPGAAGPADAGRDASGARRALPGFVAELARRMAAAHARGETAGPLHPALVFATPGGALAGTAQRVLRAVLPATSEGRAPLFATGFRTPAELRREPPTPADDVFRLASMAWAWRRGEAPFGSGMDELGGVLGGPGARDLRPADDLDRVLVAALDPDPARRPSAVELAEVIAATESRDPG